MTVRSLLGLVLATVLVACGSDGGGGKSGHGDDDASAKATGGDADGDGVPDAEEAAALRERPWEILSNKDETYLSNVFYAEPSENEQIMPWTVNGRTQIDRLVYPTLGNPNLYVKADATDELVMVLRLEPDAYAHLEPAVAADGTVTMKDGLGFYLVARSARAAAEATSAVSASGATAGVFAIKPTKILQSPEPADMPAAFKKRHTLRVVFDKTALADVPADLYDTRFEVTKDGALFANVYEYQYNAVRVFEEAKDEYTALNVTDTQVSISAEYKSLTADKLDEFVDGVNAEQSSDVKNAAFITFNGDLHNGGSPGSLFQRNVATTYTREAARIVNALKRLRLPIFLTAGNHDGYAAIGHVPQAVTVIDQKAGATLESIIGDQNNNAWPDYSWAGYSDFLARTAATPGGLHKNIYAGSFERNAGDSFSAAWKNVPRADRNMVLYDGFYQWQKTYGPLTASWTFGKNRYVSMNSYELRQHRRTGWGMYTVNYGGGMSKPQLEWLDRELARGKSAAQDIVLLMHHDPRGGHKGEDLGYYAPVVEFKGIGQSTMNYILSEELTPVVCKQPEWSLSVDQRESCLHDGLQEWMAPDAEFEKEGNAFFLSGVELLQRISHSAQVRTLVLGHVHFNSLEVLLENDPLVPNRLSLDSIEEQKTASIEASNPIRRTAWEGATGAELNAHSFDGWRQELDTMLRTKAAQTATTMSSPLGPRELAVLRFTSGSDLADQKYNGKSMFGFAILHITKQTETPRINRATYLINDGSAKFTKIQTVDVDRTKSVRTKGTANPLEKLFEW